MYNWIKQYVHWWITQTKHKDSGSWISIIKWGKRIKDREKNEGYYRTLNRIAAIVKRNQSRHMQELAEKDV